MLQSALFVFLRFMPCIALTLALGIATAAPQTSQTPKIASIRVLGLSRFSEAQVVSATGLAIGQAFNAKQLDAVVAKLGQSGAFQEITYTYRPEGSDVALQFKVKEESKLRPCLFENFVWASDSELDTRLKKEVSFYIGAAPE